MDTTPRAAILAKSLQLNGPHGRVYGPIDMHVDPGDLVVLQGPQGSGRTSLLLTLAGRMKPSASTVQLTVRGHDLPRERNAVQKVTAIAGFDGIDDLEPSVTVGDTLRERLAWLTPWYRRTPAVTDQTLRDLAAPVFGPRRVPKAATLIRDLDEVDAMLLRIVVALTAQPDVLVVDDLDQVHDTARRQIVWDRLAALTVGPETADGTTPGLTVVASIASASEVDAMRWNVEPHAVRLTTGPRLDDDAPNHTGPHAGVRAGVHAVEARLKSVGHTISESPARVAAHVARTAASEEPNA